MIGSIPRDIDVALLRAFIAVAETGGMTSAARHLNLTQAAVSQQIKRLETLFDTELFDRSQKQVRLTSTGERLVAYARRMLTLNHEVWTVITAPAFEGEVRLGVPHDVVGVFMPQILRTFSRAWPRVNVTLFSDTTPTLLAALDEKRIDLTLTTEAVRAGETLLSDNLVWVGAPDGEACKRNPLPVALGGETCAFRAEAVAALSKTGRDWRLMCQVGSLEPVFAVLEADMAVAPFLMQTAPAHLEVIADTAGLPALPAFYVNLHVPSVDVSDITAELASHIRNGFVARYQTAA
ncbi:MAG: LysR family transcriptional regulator [Hyphomicrobiaceae bacterium]